MAGIISCGAYIPKWRMSRETIAKGSRGEKAVAGPDEDSATMAVAAVLDCLNGIDRETVDGLFFASTTSPYKEKQISTIVAAAADLRRGILTADFANSLKAGTTAMKLAADVVKAGSARKVMVVAADCRIGAPGSEFEMNCADGAAAILIGSEGVAVNLEASHSISNEMIDVWRTDEDIYIRSWEERFVQTEGYLKVAREAISGLLAKSSLAAKDFAKAVFYAPNPRRATELAQALGINPKTQLQDPLFDIMGNTGAAYSLMLLVAALEEAKPGNKLLLASYGNGSDAFVLGVTEHIEKIRERRGITAHLKSKRMVPDYATYLQWRKLLKMAEPLSLGGFTAPSASSIWREYKQIIPLRGVQCKACGTIQYPPQRVCTKCHAKDNFDEVRLSDKKGKIFSFSNDGFSGLPVGLINFEGGGRIWCTMSDADIGEFEIDMPVEMSFRKLMTEGGIHNYYWKAIPLRA